MVAKQSLTRSLLVTATAITLVAVVALEAIWVSDELHQFRHDTDRLREHNTAATSRLLLDETRHAVGYIASLRASTDQRLKDSIRARVIEAHQVATSLHAARPDLRQAELGRLIKAALRPIRFNHGRGYYFATNLNGVEELFADRPEMEGRNLLGLQDTNGRYVIRDMIRIARTQGEGFIEYTWTKPGVAGDQHLKIAFVKLFRPLNWLIGTGEYRDDAKQDLQREAVRYLESLRFGTAGYLFAGQYDGLSLAGPGRGRNMLATVDLHGVRPVAELIAAARRGGGYVRYVMPAETGKPVQPKLSYAEPVAGWDWYVGAGTDMGGIEAVIQAEQRALRGRLIGQVVRGALLGLAVWLCAVVMTVVIGRRFRRELAVFGSFFEQAAQSAEPAEIDVCELRLADCRRLAEVVNHMIRERRRAAAERDEMEAHLREVGRMEAVGRLAGGVAHDFNNLLTAISGYCNFGLEALAKVPDEGSLGSLREDLEEVRAAAERAAELTRQLLAFSRQQPIAPVVLDLNAALHGLERMLRRLIGEDIEVVLDLGADVGAVLADPTQMDQVVMNLAVNAKAAMPDGGRLTLATRSLTLTAPPPEAPELLPGEWVVLQVADTGCGMDQATRERIFEPFFTTKEPGQGTGLGLATVYGIVNQNGGQITCHSAVGEGTTFTVYLPRTGPVEAPPAAAPPPAAGGSETILLVEDEEPVRTLAERVLQRRGYRVVAVAGPLEALDRLGDPDQAFDLLLTDLLMPEMNGRELARRARQVRPDLPVMFVSGYASDIEPAAGRLLPKPYTPAQLWAAVREVLDTGA